LSKLLKEDAPSLLRLNLQITIKICDSPRKSKRGVTRPDHVKTATVPNRKMRLSSCPGHIFFSCRARLRVVVFTGGENGRFEPSTAASCRLQLWERTWSGFVPTTNHDRQDQAYRTSGSRSCMAGQPAASCRVGVGPVATGLCLCLFDPTHQQVCRVTRLPAVKVECRSMLRELAQNLDR